MAGSCSSIGRLDNGIGVGGGNYLSKPAASCWLDFSLLRNLLRIIYLDAEVANGAFLLGMTKQQLNGPQIVCALVDQGCIDYPHGMRPWADESSPADSAQWCTIHAYWPVETWGTLQPCSETGTDRLPGEIFPVKPTVQPSSVRSIRTALAAAFFSGSPWHAIAPDFRG